jgi:hypothetical protein
MPLTELEAVNRILVSAQMQPVTTLSSPDRDTSKADQMLLDTNAREQERGWDFNSDYNVTLTAVASNFTVPTTPWTVLSLDVRPDQSSKDIVVRDGKLYDKTNNTFTFTETTIDVDITYLITFPNLSLVFQEYVVACACVRFAEEVSVDPMIAQQLRANEARAWQRVKQADNQQSRQSIYYRWPLNWISRRWPNFATPTSWGRGG